MSGAIILYLDTPEGLVDEVELPTIMEVCGTCSGKGTTVDPAIDGHGISPEEFADDPDFAESYFRGDYDVPCRTCSGHKVVPVADLDKMSPDYRSAYESQLSQQAADQQEIELERKHLGLQ